MSTNKLTRTIVLAGAMALLVGAVTSMTNTVFAAPPPGAGPSPEPQANHRLRMEVLRVTVVVLRLEI
jgi:hypothetical protein